MKSPSKPQVNGSVGQGMLEYALIILLIALFVVIVLPLLNEGMSNVLEDLVQFLS